MTNEKQYHQSPLLKSHKSSGTRVAVAAIVSARDARRATLKYFLGHVVDQSHLLVQVGQMVVQVITQGFGDLDIQSPPQPDSRHALTDRVVEGHQDFLVHVDIESRQLVRVGVILVQEITQGLGDREIQSPLQLEKQL